MQKLPYKMLCACHKNVFYRYLCTYKTIFLLRRICMCYNVLFLVINNKWRSINEMYDTNMKV